MRQLYLISTIILFVGMFCFCDESPQELNQVRKYQPGDSIAKATLEEIGPEPFFTCKHIPDSVFALMQGKSFKENCTVSREELRYITVLHKDMDGRILLGEMVVSAGIAPDLLQIFRRLYDEGYPIERMLLVDNYDADDEQSMSANNSSSFNFRFISHTTTVSKHGLGMAVDINPLYNPYHKFLSNGTEVIEPALSRPYLDRDKDFPYKINDGDLCCRLFKEHGFEWGGDWTSCKDYQHFEHQ